MLSKSERNARTMFDITRVLMHYFDFIAMYMLIIVLLYGFLSSHSKQKRKKQLRTASERKLWHLG